MDLGAVMDEVADRLRTIDGLRVYAYPADAVAPPAAVVTYPDEYVFDATFGRGMDTMTLPVIVMVGKVSDRASRDRVAAYCAGGGAGSVKAAVEADDPAPVAYDTARVQAIDFDILMVGQVEYLGATFTIDIAGTGAPA